MDDGKTIATADVLQVAAALRLMAPLVSGPRPTVRSLKQAVPAINSKLARAGSTAVVTEQSLKAIVTVVFEPERAWLKMADAAAGDDAAGPVDWERAARRVGEVVDAARKRARRAKTGFEKGGDG